MRQKEYITEVYCPMPGPCFPRPPSPPTARLRFPLRSSLTGRHPGNVVRKPSAYSAESTRVLCGKYNSALRKASARPARRDSRKRGWRFIAQGKEPPTFLAWRFCQTGKEERRDLVSNILTTKGHKKRCRFSQSKHL